MALNPLRPLSRRVVRGVIAALLFAQMAVAAYACPRWAGAAPAADVAASASETEAVHDCSDAMDASDPAASNLCAEHCKAGNQIDQVAGPVVLPTAMPAYALKSASPPALRPRRATAAWASDLVAASPPRAILHCVRRT